ncbi:MAG: hypothetical protein ACR2PL_18365 [Dehalococcoidia bacterium]
MIVVVTQRQSMVPAGDSDARAVASMPDVLGVYRNSTSWFNNASFLLPLAGAILVGLAGAVTRSFELLGFAGFLALVTFAMLPLVLVTWRQTATAVILTRDRIVTVHDGHPLKTLAWDSIQAIRRRETQGNVRWEISNECGERILLDGEIDDLPALLNQAHELSGLSNE